MFQRAAEKMTEETQHLQETGGARGQLRPRVEGQPLKIAETVLKRRQQDKLAREERAQSIAQAKRVRTLAECSSSSSSSSISIRSSSSNCSRSCATRFYSGRCSSNYSCCNSHTRGRSSSTTAAKAATAIAAAAAGASVAAAAAATAAAAVVSFVLLYPSGPEAKRTAKSEDGAVLH